MTKTVTGVLKKITAKTGTSPRGPWTAYSLGISVDGADDYEWFRYGFKAPDATEGSVVSFDVTEEGEGIWRVVGSINVDKNASAADAAATKSSASRSYGGKSDTVQDQIVRQNALGSAIASVDSMLDQGVVKLPAGAEKRYDAYLALLDKLTNRFFVANRSAKSVEDLASDGIEDAVNESAPEEPAGPTDAEAWSPV